MNPGRRAVENFIRRAIDCEIRGDELIRPSAGAVEYDTSITEEYPWLPLKEFCAILADNLFDWSASIRELLDRHTPEELLADHPMTDDQLAVELRLIAERDGQKRLFS